MIIPTELPLPPLKHFLFLNNLKIPTENPSFGFVWRELTMTRRVLAKSLNKSNLIFKAQ
jgi:hypothetical protein